MSVLESLFLPNKNFMGRNETEYKELSNFGQFWIVRYATFRLT